MCSDMQIASAKDDSIGAIVQNKKLKSYQKNSAIGTHDSFEVFLLYCK